MAGGQSLKQGEKILFGIAIAFIGFAVLAYLALEAYRLRASGAVFEVTTHFDLSADGQRGSELFRTHRCTACHRAMRNGTNMGLSLDGLGSRRTQEWIYNFLRDPEAVYGAKTFDHGYPPKEAASVSLLPSEELRLISIFLSELKSDQGSPSAPAPPKGESAFVDNMLKNFAPESWKEKYSDVREKEVPQEKGNAPSE
ncbi:MAG: cytochrome c [Chromatiales bacterium]|jgi:hypothetical protein|nr:cytochrome c [Chromatiales bacterium]